MSEVILEAKNIFLSFHGVAALTNVSFKVHKGEIFSIIGPNGAGKTCMMNCVNGLYHPKQGTLHLKGVDITKYSPHKRAAMGLSQNISENRIIRWNDSPGQYSTWEAFTPQIWIVEFMLVLGEDIQRRN